MRPWNTRNEDRDVDFRRRVLNAVDSLPIDQVLAVWLVDTCSLSYIDAAHIAQRPLENIQELVHDARHQIRSHIAATQPPSHFFLQELQAREDVTMTSPHTC